MSFFIYSAYSYAVFGGVLVWFGVNIIVIFGRTSLYFCLKVEFIV